MSFLDMVSSFFHRLASGGGRGSDAPASNLQNGGRTGYHPGSRRTVRHNQEEAGYPAQPPRNPTGAYFASNRGQQVGVPSPDMAGGYQGQQPYYAPGYEGQYSGMRQAGYPPQTPQEPQWQWNASAPFPQVPPQSAPQSGYASQEVQGNGNISYMPGNFVGDDGQAYKMVQRLAQPLSSASCYRLIEFMRNGESIVVNTELIQDEHENTRALDLLYGAAFTMNYTFTRISSRSIYLISPATVMVMPYESIRQMSDEDQARRWPGSTPPAPQEASAPRRGFSFRTFEEESGMDGWNQRRYSQA